MFKGNQLICHIPTLVDRKEVRKCLDDISHQWMKIQLKMASDPFSEGEQRISYHGIEIDAKTEKGDRMIVLKEFKHSGRGRDRRRDYIEIMETQAIAAYLANSFNEISPRGTKKIEFLGVCYGYVRCKL